MKAHISIDVKSEMIHTVTATADNVHDIVETHKLIRKDDKIIYGDTGYLCIENRKEYKICKKPTVVQQMNDNLYLR